MDIYQAAQDAAKRFGVKIAFVDVNGYASATKPFSYATKSGYQGKARNFTQVLECKTDLVSINGVAV